MSKAKCRISTGGEWGRIHREGVCIVDSRLTDFPIFAHPEIVLCGSVHPEFKKTHKAPRELST
jgi:3-polyprenyl-4-hydroxybenzoate decarboxylase